MKKIRLDQLLTERGFFPSRERAKIAIMEGKVYVAGQRALKPGAPTDPAQMIEVRGEPMPYVSRGGLKLEKGLRVFARDPAGLVCLDGGASTGGFTDVLLRSGAARVYAVDVGYGQLAWRLRNDPRVRNLERTNLRYVTAEQIPEPIDLAVMDLAFISLKLVLPPVAALLKPEGEILCLIKPQFEAGREKVGKKGVVRDPAVHRAVLEDLTAFFTGAGFTVAGLAFSPIRGPEGNIEYLAWLRKDGQPGPVLDIPALVEQSHQAFQEKRHEEDSHEACDTMSQSL